MQPNQPNPYAFITNPPPPPKQPLFGGWSMKQRGIILGVGIVFVLILVSVISNIMSAGSEAGVLNMKRVLARQTEIIRVADLAAAGGQATETRAMALNVSLTVSSDKNRISKILADGKIKVTAQELGARLDAQADTALNEAASNGRYDETFRQLIFTQLTDYLSLLETAHSTSSTETTKAELQKSHANATLLQEALK